MRSFHAALMSSQDPSFQQSCYPVDSREQSAGILGSSLNPRPMAVVGAGNAQISPPSVGDQGRACGDRASNKAIKGRACRIRDRFQPDAAHALASHLARNGDQGLVSRQPTSDFRFTGTDERLVHLDFPRKLISSWTDHGSPQLMQPGPSRLVAAESQDPLQSQGTGSVLLGHHPPHDLEPKPQGLPGPMEDGPRSSRSLMATLGAVHEGLHRQPSLGRDAPWTSEPLRPAKRCEVMTTGFLGGKTTIELGQGTRIVRLVHATILPVAVT